ncbi:MAG TPA: CatB-related O-acetyltransferase [Alphaproteobacteria bacterium]
MSILEYAVDDLPGVKGFDAFLLRAKAKGFLRKKLLRRSRKRFGNRDDLSRHYALKRFGIRIGKYSYDFRQFLYANVMLQEIGAFCSIAPNVTIPFGLHPSETVSTHPTFYESRFGFTPHDIDISQFIPKNRKVTIGHDVWIGTNVTILTGITIGTGAIIGAGAVVTKDVPPYAIIAGVPAKILRYRFDEETIEKLLASKWWTWPDTKIMAELPKFLNTAEFCQSI